MNLSEKSLVKEYRKLYRIVDRPPTSVVRDNTMRMRQIRQILRVRYDYSWRDLSEIVETQE